MGLRAWLGLKRLPAGRFRGPRSPQVALIPNADPGRVRRMMRLLRPMRAVGVGKVRVGREHDCGYVMLDDFADVTAAFSCGIGADCSWDLSIAERGIAVHQFDHTIDRSPTSHDLFRFHQVRLSGGPGPSRITTGEISQMIAKPWAILKMDIEGDEWPVLAAARRTDLQAFSQIVLELHDLSQATDAQTATLYESVLERISADFQCVHVHGNNCMALAFLGGVPVPDVLEVTLANRHRYAFAETDELFPTAIDMANNPKTPDLWLGSFRF